MSTKNLGQVSGVHVGSTPPENKNLIWYDDSPTQKLHKVYDFNLNQWVILKQGKISNTTYSELVDLATRVGLTIGAWFQISDRWNALALVISSTKVQYNDSSGNIMIDDLGNNIQYHVTSSNLLVDGVLGSFDSSWKRLVFNFNEQVPNFISDDFVLGKIKRGGIWSLAKYKLSYFLSKVTGNSITWNGGFFFNFNNSINNILDKTDGVVSKNTFDNSVKNLNTSINNVGKENQNIIQNASNKIKEETTAAKIYEKEIPSDLETGGSAIDVAKGDSLYSIVSKVQRWINKFKYANGINISNDFKQADSESSINTNDTVESAFGKVQYWFKNIKLILSDAFTPPDRNGVIEDIAPKDDFETAFGKTQGKFNQIGDIENGLISSKDKTSYDVPVSVLNLKTGNIGLKNASNEYQNSNLNSEGLIVESYNGKTVVGRNSVVSCTNSNGESAIDGNGITATGINKSMYGTTLGITKVSSIIGRADGNVKRSYLPGQTSVIAGVFGTSSNSNPEPCDHFGGYFEKLKALGLYLDVKTTANSYNMSDKEVFLICKNTDTITVTLPPKPTMGQVIYIHQTNAISISVSATPELIMSSDKIPSTNILLAGGDTAYKTFMFVYVGHWIKVF